MDDLDDDLSIGEVSRVVRLADIASGRAAPAARQGAGGPQPTAASAAIARGTGAVARVDGPALADAAPIAGGDAPSIYQSVTAPPPRRRTFLYLGAAVVVLAVIAVVVIVATSGAGSAADEAQVGATRHYDDLGGVHRPLDRGAGRDPQVEAADAGVGAGTGSARRPGGGSAQVRPGGGSASGSGPGSGSASGKVETPVLGPDGQPLRPLTADDVFAMSSKMEIGTRRCYERALKDDPFLKVSKIRATITVKPGGEVSSVQLSSMQGTPLATCLTAAIGRWRFRASTEGIVSEFALVFEQR
ncbi:MAG: AgmX/PglI C-terminal domain-containing protein [Kofleriaceae bacterium]|nr:AgmX/PglI C-terminal domain-containing protein [Kofleriaceae bacterium]